MLQRRSPVAERSPKAAKDATGASEIDAKRSEAHRRVEDAETYILVPLVTARSLLLVLRSLLVQSERQTESARRTPGRAPSPSSQVVLQAGAGQLLRAEPLWLRY